MWRLLFPLLCAKGSGLVPPSGRTRLGLLPRAEILSVEEWRTPLRTLWPIADSFVAASECVPDGVVSSMKVANFIFISLVIGGYEFPGVDHTLLEYTTVGSFFFGALGLWKPFEILKSPEYRAARDLNAPYAPPEAGPWAGPISTKTVITDFVEKNLNGQTLVLVDESGKVKPELLDNMLRGRVRVLSPAMEQLRLSADISKKWGYKNDEALGLDEIVEAIGEVVKPGPPFFKYPPELVPVIAIINVPSDATEDDVTKILRDVATLKSKAGENIITVVCLERPDYGLDRLRLNLASFQIEDIPVVCLTDLVDGDLKADLRSALTIEQIEKAQEPST